MKATPTYFETFDIKQLLSEFPLEQGFTERFRNISRDELFAQQDVLFKRCVARAWQIPFYQRLWGAQGIEAGDINGLADIT